MRIAVAAALLAHAGALSTRGGQMVRHRPSLSHRQSTQLGLRRSSAQTSMLAPAASEALARGLGWAISGASMSLYLPIAANIARTRSAAGLSVATWALNTLGFVAALVYPMRRGFPLSSYFDTVCLTLQSVLVLTLIVAYRGSRTEGAALVAGLGACALAFAATLTLAPAWSLVAVQAAASVSMTVALLPQIYKNAVRRSSGGWSRTSAALSTVGNAIRVFTTITLTGDRLLLAGFAAGLLLNGVLLAQTLLWKE